jgi:hypothetical protein
MRSARCGRRTADAREPLASFKGDVFMTTYHRLGSLVLVATIGSMASAIGCAQPGAGFTEAQGLTTAKLLAPEPMVTATASHEATEELGIVRWELYQGTRGVVFTGRDESGNAVKGLSAGFRQSADDAQLFASVNDGNGFSGAHSFRARALATSTLPAASAAFTARALSDLTRLHALLTSSASPDASCGQNLAAVLLTAMTCIQKGGSSDQCLAPAQAAARAGAACSARSSASTGSSGSQGSTKRKAPTKRSHSDSLDINDTSIAKRGNGELEVSVNGNGNSISSGVVNYNTYCAPGATCNFYSTTPPKTGTPEKPGGPPAELPGLTPCIEGLTCPKLPDLTDRKTGGIDPKPDAPPADGSKLAPPGELTVAEAEVPTTPDKVNADAPFGVTADGGSVPDGAADVVADKNTGDAVAVADNTPRADDGASTSAGNEVAAASDTPNTSSSSAGDVDTASLRANLSAP